MALMIFMQKWCWFHFPKYYSFILHYFFFTGLEACTQSQPSSLLRCRVVCACGAEQLHREEGEELQPGR